MIPQLQQRECLVDIIFKWNSATLHIDCSVKQLLRQRFTGSRGISCQSPTAWPPCVLDIISCNFCFCDFPKENIFCLRQASVPDLKGSIQTSILKIHYLRSTWRKTWFCNRETLLNMSGRHIEKF